ncbi:hypothetical protein CDD82_2933 [Ophiocordyceps australis]|uniref:Mediator of RNA polymerase II transcription subunit 4 n=1 Tax=Ophiocordyceps australis TaxID=1399860 RepID=A0A2C5ZFQ3_9HYPO|nr:hypothetical protein CDD82_2933 [Ophiocordyceps australis]
MDKVVDSAFDRLEKALASLTDSVTKYQPSVSQAEELRAADTQLRECLEQVESHQNSYYRLQDLRQTSATLDAQIRDTLMTLASTRRDLVATPTTKFSNAPHYPIVYEELLSYARRISKTTMPPAATLATPVGAPNAATPSSTPDTHTPGPAASDALPHSATTPTAPTPSGTQSPIANGAPTQLPAADQQSQAILHHSQQTGSSSQNTSLPQVMSQYMNPLSGQLFFPWPSEDKIRCGALAAIQRLVDQGIDPKGYDPATEEERKRQEEQGRKAKEDREKAEREHQLREERERLRIERERQRELEQESWRRASLVSGHSDALPAQKSASPSAGEKKQFQFANFDLEDDDE